MINNTFVKYWVPVILWVGFTFWMSTGTFNANHTSLIIEPILRFFLPHSPESTIVFIHGIIRKLAHVTEYFALGLLLYRAIHGQFKNLELSQGILYALLVVMLLAGADEYHQSFVSTRTASIVDVGFDTFGGFLGLCVILLWNRLKSKNLIEKM